MWDVRKNARIPIYTLLNQLHIGILTFYNIENIARYTSVGIFEPDAVQKT